MQIIRVDAISNAVQHLQSRYQFEGNQHINRWLTMRLANELFAGRTDLDDILDSILPDLPPNRALAGTTEPKTYEDLREDLRRAAEAVLQKVDDIMGHVATDFEAITEDVISPECWIAYHEIDDKTFAISLRDNQTDPVLLSMAPIDAALLTAAEVMHIVDGKIIIEGKVIDPEDI